MAGCNCCCLLTGSLGCGLMFVVCTCGIIGSVTFLCVFGKGGGTRRFNCPCGTLIMGVILIKSTGIHRGFIVNKVGFLGQGVLEAFVLSFPKLRFFAVCKLPGSFSEELDFELICVSDWTLSCVGWVSDWTLSCIGWVEGPG